MGHQAGIGGGWTLELEENINFQEIRLREGAGKVRWPRSQPEVWPGVPFSTFSPVSWMEIHHSEYTKIWNFPYNLKSVIISWALLLFSKCPQVSRIKQTLHSSPHAPSPNVWDNFLKYWFVSPSSIVLSPLPSRWTGLRVQFFALEEFVIHKSRNCL